ncbi:MAG TPA: gluconate 2-dehydrogenase subunit 3 family protein [Terriglobales bacterium]|nr:gluconate 2-dehydrogenase subunit 3 family protein [Terriglobales bacterium]
MAGQSIERREILRMLALAAGAASFPGFCRWTFACGHLGSGIEQIRPAAYRPAFFTAAQYATIERLADIIIPTDETPGASQAGVAEFIDLMVSRDATLQANFRSGLEWLGTHSRKTFGNNFLLLAPTKQAGLMESLAYHKKYRAGEERGREFFNLVRQYTVMGFYTSEIGLKELDCPGLKFYAESPACPHKDDPEHLHLPRPKG